ncbi:MAG: cytochrome c3 family protein [Planctomycetota bacterium]
MAKRENPPRGLIFPPWIDQLTRLLGMVLAFGGVYVVLLVTFGASPRTTDVGYMPEQPVPYSHALHAGELGIDCRYCHTGVEVSAAAAIPPTQTCMNCHRKVLPDSVKLKPVVESYQTGVPVRWVRVHDLPDYVYFNHSAHVTRGVSCVSCHDRVDRMVEVYQAMPLSMGWCLQCHRDPARELRPRERVTDLGWGGERSGEERTEAGRAIMRDLGLLDEQGHETERMELLTNCSTCHR